MAERNDSRKRLIYHVNQESRTFTAEIEIDGVVTPEGVDPWIDALIDEMIHRAPPPWEIASDPSATEYVVEEFP